MTTINEKYEFELTEDVVYRVKPTSIANIPLTIHVKGTGSIDILASTLEPADANDLTLNSEDTDLLGYFNFNSLPNFIKVTQNQAGSRTVVLKGTQEPEVVTF